MTRTIIFRIIIDIFLAFCILNGTWFVALPLGIFGVWNFPYFVEIIIAGIAYDSLFGFTSGMGAWGYAGTIVSIGILVLVSVLKEVVRK